jgi:hypothetical protein
MCVANGVRDTQMGFQEKKSPGVFIITLFCTVRALRWTDPQPRSLMRGGQAQHCASLPTLVIFDIPRKVFKRLSKNLQKPGKLYCATVFCAVLWVLKVPFSR